MLRQRAKSEPSTSSVCSAFDGKDVSSPPRSWIVQAATTSIPTDVSSDNALNGPVSVISETSARWKIDSPVLASGNVEAVPGPDLALRRAELLQGSAPCLVLQLLR